MTLAGGSVALRMATRDAARPVGMHYPMAWDFANHDIAGVERTELYEKACGTCP